MKINTTKEGYLPESYPFENTVNNQNLIVHPTNMKFIEELMLDALDAYVMIDGGRDHSKSNTFCKIVESHAYNITSTADNVSHQNGIV